MYSKYYLIVQECVTSIGTPSVLCLLYYRIVLCTLGHRVLGSRHPHAMHGRVLIMRTSIVLLASYSRLQLLLDTMLKKLQLQQHAHAQRQQDPGSAFSSIYVRKQIFFKIKSSPRHQFGHQLGIRWKPIGDQLGIRSYEFSSNTVP